MKVYEGPGMIAEKSGATLLPVRIDGAQFTHVSKLKNILKRRIFPKITITILPPIQFSDAHKIQGMDNREKRKFMGQVLYDIMADMMFESADYKTTLFQSLIEAAKIHGIKKEIVQDTNFKPVTYKQLLLESFRIAELIKENTEEHCLGFMMPNIVKTISMFYAIQACGRKVVMIDYTIDIESIISRCKTTEVKIIYTSKEFIKKSELQKLIAEIEEFSIKIIYIEDLEQRISLYLKAKSYICQFFPESYYSNMCDNHDDKELSVVIFTKGSI